MSIEERSTNTSKRKYHYKIDASEARRLYVEQCLSLAEVGKRFGTSRQAVYERLKNAGVKFRPRGRTSRLDKAEIIKLYVHEVRTLDETAERFGVSRETVRRWLVRLGIERHSNGDRRRGPRSLAVVYKLSVGQSVEMPAANIPSRRSNLYRMAKNAGLRLSAKQAGPDRLQVTRIG